MKEKLSASTHRIKRKLVPHCLTQQHAHDTQITAKQEVTVLDQAQSEAKREAWHTCDAQMAIEQGAALLGQVQAMLGA